MKEQGILVHGSNHFIVNGPQPTVAEARALIRRWELPVIGFRAPADDPLGKWSICTKAFRENLQWAIVLSTDSGVTDAVRTLLMELEGRGVSPVTGKGPLQ